MDQQTASEQAAAPQDEPATRGKTKRGKVIVDPDPANTRKANARTKAEQAAYAPEYDRPGPRRSSEDRANAFNTLAWMVDGATGLVEELRHSDLGLSEEFWVHLYAMRREGLLAARAAIDSLLARTEREAQQAQEQSQRQARRGEVKVE